MDDRDARIADLDLKLGGLAIHLETAGKDRGAAALVDAARDRLAELEEENERLRDSLLSFTERARKAADGLSEIANRVDKTAARAGQRKGAGDG